ncbi:hypothetical protein AWM78_18385 [Bacillus subtilis subsp. subtilis]|nr:hypothetical protein AWM78_18385 [Bacillus subtilis subsp. subtilis]GLI90165.1 hypothetical protein ANABIO4_35170 [Bacillus subtilis]
MTVWKHLQKQSFTSEQPCVLKDYLALEQETAELFINEVLLSKERHSWFIFHVVFKPKFLIGLLFCAGIHMFNK